jgi:hypothetical protein
VSTQTNATGGIKPVFAVQKAAERYYADQGWLKTYHSFSFADYYDPQNLNWGALRVFNDDTIAGGTGFPAHPHRDMEIVTYILSGELEHQDSIGNHGVVKPGGIQFMSAGTGVRHSEYNHLPDTPLHLVQMWVIPGKIGQPPSYGQADFTLEDRRNRWLVCVSGEAAVDAAIRITQQATLRVACLENVQLTHEFAPHRYGFAFVADGELEVNGEELQPGDAARTFNLPKLDVRGSGELVFWDVPASTLT